MTMYIILKYLVILLIDATARASTAKVSGWWVVVSSYNASATIFSKELILFPDLRWENGRPRPSTRGKG